MNNEALSNDLNVRIEIAVQCVMCNLDVQFQQQNSDSAANIISFSVFKLEEIEYFDSELNIWYDEKNIIIIEKNSYI